MSIISLYTEKSFKETFEAMEGSEHLVKDIKGFLTSKSKIVWLTLEAPTLHDESEALYNIAETLYTLREQRKEVGNFNTLHPHAEESYSTWAVDGAEETVVKEEWLPKVDEFTKELELKRIIRVSIPGMQDYVLIYGEKK